MNFDSFVGIDYSGAKTADTGLKGIQVFAAKVGQLPEKIANTVGHKRRNWNRRAVAHWLLERLQTGERLLVGIDHGFSFPETYFQCYGLKSWDDFLADFHRYWPTDEEDCLIDAIREGTWWVNRTRPIGERTGKATELRLSELWTASASSVFRMDGQGSVGKSTHAGLPWLQFLRERCGHQLHFWPFDGWRVPDGKSLIAEAYPSLFRRRYPKEYRTPDQQDAYAIARWLEETVRRGALERYLQPPLTLPERKTAELEGWILGVT
ncbi:MAG: hypothetical protein HQL77_04285 [Magnetococcales bacterium]|nr:hypothetical protein [Magnetococcales bacterium]